jgi:flagellar basal-body rod protein FlgC
VQAAISNTLPSYTLAYDPSAPFANLQGMVAAPNVDPVAETVNQISAAAAFQANLSVFKAADKDLNSLLDMLA